MENKYYIPDIEDMRVGYECEANPKLYGSVEDVWRPTIMRGVGQEVIYYHSLGVYRTPYLIKEQIEAEGWEYKTTNKIRYWYEKESPEIGGNWYGYYIYKAKLIHDPEMKYLKILFSFDAIEDECMFEGECKSINELRIIQKMLRI